MLAPKYGPELELMVYLSRREENLDSKALRPKSGRAGQRTNRMLKSASGASYA